MDPAGGTFVVEGTSFVAAAYCNYCVDTAVGIVVAGVVVVVVGVAGVVVVLEAAFDAGVASVEP